MSYQTESYIYASSSDLYTTFPCSDATFPSKEIPPRSSEGSLVLPIVDMHTTSSEISNTPASARSTSYIRHDNFHLKPTAFIRTVSLRQPQVIFYVPYVQMKELSVEKESYLLYDHLKRTADFAEKFTHSEFRCGEWG